MKRQILIIDTSAILSGKPINFPDSEMITTPSVSEELSPGGRDYRNFEFLKEKGLIIQSPSKESILKIKKIAEETGDINRLSNADIELLALALDKIMMKNRDVCILTDDYSIQNIANNLNIDYKNISQKSSCNTYKN